MVHVTLVNAEGTVVMEQSCDTPQQAAQWEADNKTAALSMPSPVHTKTLEQVLSEGEEYLLQFGFDPATREAFATQAFLSTLNPDFPGAWTTPQIQRYSASAAWVLAFWQGAKTAVAQGIDWAPSGQPPYNQTQIIQGNN